MTFSLHTMRTLAHRLGVGLALVLLWSSLAMALPLPIRATAPHHAQPPEMPAMVHHHAEHAAAHHASQPTLPPATMHNHTDGACCLSGQHCTMACTITLLAVSDSTISRGVHVIPLVHPSAQALTRPPQPPRRPPKA